MAKSTSVQRRSAGPATVITRRQTPVTFAAGAKQITQITRQLAMRGIYLHLTVTPTVTGANNTAANTKLGDEWACVQKIELIANGTTTLFSFAGSDIKSMCRILYGFQPRINTTLGDGATANPALDSTVWIPFLNPRSIRPFDTLLFTGELSDLRLEVTWAADQTSINGTATGFTVAPSIEVYTREQTLPTDANGQPVLPNFYRRTLKIPVQISGANSAFRYQLNTGPIYRGLILNELSGVPAESHTILTNVKVFSGPTTFIDVNAESLYEFGNEQAKIPQFQYGIAAGGFFQSSGQASTAADPRSWRWLDFCDDGRMSEALDTDSIGDTFLEFNVNAAATINIFTQELLRINRGGSGNVTASA